MTKVALLIGVSDCGPGFNSLPRAAKDVAAMQRILQHPDLGDFSEVETLINPNPLAMQMAIEALFKDKVRQRDDLALLFFSGHCVNDHNNKLYFATRITRKNSQGELVKSTTVSANFLQDIMSDSRSKQQVLILDCCFSNAFTDVWSAKNYGSVDVKNQLGKEGRVVLTASNCVQNFLQPKDSQSNYTRHLVEGIETGAADLDQDQCISVYELHQYASRKAEETTTIEPQIYAVKESYNILLAKTPKENSQLGGNVTAHTSPNLRVVVKDASFHKFHPISSQIYSHIPRFSNPQSLIGTSIITVLALAGTIYGLYRWQDLQQLPMSESIAADTTYKNQVPTVFEHTNTVWSLAFSPDSQILASSSGDKTIKLWQLKSGELLRTFSGSHVDTIWSVAISPNEQNIVSGSGDKTVKVWDLNTGKLLRTLVGHLATVRSVAISPNGQNIVSGSGDKTVKVWDLNTGKLLRTLGGHLDAVRAVAISPNGKTIASGSADNTIKIWNLNTGKLLYNLTGHTGRIISIAISPDGQLLASGSNDNTIKLWNLHTGELVRTLFGHTDHINSIAFRADGKVLVSGAEDHLIKLWNVATGEVLETLTKHSEDVYSVAISPDGKILASGDKEGEIKLGR